MEEIKMSAIQPLLINISAPTENEVRGKGYISWGDDNKFPQYILELLNSSSIFGSIVRGMMDYIVGDGVVSNLMIERFNSDGDTIEDIFRKAALDLVLFDGFAIQVFRDITGRITSIYNLDLANIRLSKDGKDVYYSPNWSNFKNRPAKYPAFDKDDIKENSIYVYKGPNARVDNIYPSPSYIGALNDIRTSAEISNFHLTSVLNNFNASAIINFNNGDPDDETKRRIETMIKEKFCGTTNGSSLLINWNDNKDSAVTIERLASDDFANRYDLLSKSITKNIFTAFRATPNLFGLITENNSFNSQEYDSAFKLYNRTVIQPIQKQLIRCFDKIFGVSNSITIKPFQINIEEA